MKPLECFLSILFSVRKPDHLESREPQNVAQIDVWQQQTYSARNLDLKLLVTESRVFEENMTTLCGSATTIIIYYNNTIMLWIIIYYVFINMN